MKSVLTRGLAGRLVLTACATPPARQTLRPAESGAKESSLGAESVMRPAPTGGLTAGTLIGAIVGKGIGKTIRRADELRAADALEKNRTGEASSWVNAETGNWVSVMPSRTYQLETGQFCREYQADVDETDGKGRGHGRACRESDGSWKLVSRL